MKLDAEVAVIQTIALVLRCSSMQCTTWLVNYLHLHYITFTFSIQTTVECNVRACYGGPDLQFYIHTDKLQYSESSAITPP